MSAPKKPLARPGGKLTKEGRLLAAIRDVTHLLNNPVDKAANDELRATLAQLREDRRRDQKEHRKELLAAKVPNRKLMDEVLSLRLDKGELVNALAAHKDRIAELEAILAQAPAPDGAQRTGGAQR